MKILIVDKDLPFAMRLTNELISIGHTSNIYSNCKQAYDAILNISHDLIIINIDYIGDESSIFVESFNKIQSIPIIVTSQNGELETKIYHLKAGAVDYVVKPVDFEEFIARVKLQLRKIHHQSAPTSKLVFDDLIIYLSKNCVERNGKLINLTKQEFATLLYLARRKGELVTREELFENVWGNSNLNSSNLINVAIRRLRRKLDEGHDRKFLHTVHGIGYIAEYRD